MAKERIDHLLEIKTTLEKINTNLKGSLNFPTSLSDSSKSHKDFVGSAIHSNNKTINLINLTIEHL